MNKKIIGQKVRIEYFDQNESFAPELPRTGTITRRLRTNEGVDNWFLLELDNPFEYQIKIGEPFQFKLLSVSKFLIRSRWNNHEICGEEEVSVFILLILDDSLLQKEPINIDDFYPVAWGMCYKA